MVTVIHCKRESAETISDRVLLMGKPFKAKITKISCVNRQRVKWVLSNSGWKYVKLEFQDCLKERSIVHDILTAYSPESNRRARRPNRMLMNMEMTMLLYMKDAPKPLRAKAVNAAF